MAKWGELHLNQGLVGGTRVLPRAVFRWATSVQSPATLPGDKPRHGFFWWINDNRSPQSELGDQLPLSAVLGSSGCLCLVIPEQKVVGVRMYNRLGGPAGYDYLSDVRTFGNRVMASL